MRTDKHTPGPWRIRELVNGDLAIYGQGEYEPVAPRRDGILSPDARLIAAAPDLYEACQAAFLLLSEYAPIWAVRVEDQLREALAKTRG